MTYETYETRAFILSAHNVGESNRVFRLFTEDLGLIRGHAQSVRKEESKLRYNVQSFSQATVSLVRGKEYWKIVGAENARHLFTRFSGRTAETKLLRHIFDLLIRLVQGEEGDAYLFAVLEETVSTLDRRTLDQSSLRRLELLSVARVLHSLGYFPDRENYHSLFMDSHVTPERLEAIQSIEQNLVRDINDALSQSQL